MTARRIFPLPWGDGGGVFRREGKVGLKFKCWGRGGVPKPNRQERNFSVVGQRLIREKPTCEGHAYLS